MHSKEKVIKPLLENELHIKTETLNSLDTNQFGTFTGTVRRKGSQLKAAIAKAKAGIKLTNNEIAIASEGSFCPSSINSLIPMNIELIVFLDTKNDLLVKGTHVNHKLMYKSQAAKSTEEALKIAKEFGFPNCGIVLKKNQNARKILTQEITTVKELESYLVTYFKKPFTKSIHIETDMRAHRNPERMANIQLATQDLIKKLKTPCPKCRMPGFGINGYQYGLECEICNKPTQQKKYEVHFCSHCKYEELRSENIPDKANPRYCSHCNP